MLKFFTTALFAFALIACAETAEAVEVPPAIQSAFEAAYPSATDVKWENDGEIYEVEFKMNGEAMEAEFSPTGEQMDMQH